MEEHVKILVVDDNAENLKVVGNFFKEKDYKIALALDGESALSILDNNDIDLILLDVMMPVMNGYELCRRIKSKDKIREIPVLFLTAKSQTEDLVEGFNAGGVDYISKPFNRDELFIRVKNHLDLSTSKKKIIEMNITRDKLYSIIAHDVRSPLTEIQFTLKTISKGLLDTSSEEFKKMMLLLEKSTSQTKTLLDDLLEWLKFQGSKMTMNYTNLNIGNVVNVCVGFLNGLAVRKNICIEQLIADNTFAFADEQTIRAVFRNIISNAIKFTPEFGSIKIYCEKVGDFVKIIVQDSGVGMSSDVIHKIMDKKVYYSSLGTQKESGSGLGLQIVKDFVALNNGSLQIESTEGKGTSLIVNLRIRES